MEKTLVIVKPDAVEKKLVGEILKIYEDNGLKIEDLYMCNASEELLAKHYAEHIKRDFYPDLLEFMMSGKIVVALISGENAIDLVRKINGATNPAKSNPCTIRFLFGSGIQRNAVHGSAVLEDANREIEIWFAN